LVVDDAETIVYANASAQAILCTTREEICGKSFWRGAPHLVSTPLYQAVQKAKQTREPTDVAYMSPATNTWLHVSLSPTEEGLALFFQENLEPLPLQHALSWNEQLYRDLLESFADGVTIVTPEGLVLDINQRPLADAHLRREEAVGKPLADLPAWSSDPAVQEHLRAAIARASRGETVRFETRIHPRKDLSLDISMTITSHRDASQQVEYLICAGRDITERTRAEDDLHTLVDAIPHFVWIMHPDGSSEYGNQRWCDYTAMAFEHYQGDGWLQAIYPDDRQQTLTAWHHALATGESYEIEQRLRNGQTGTYRWFLARGMPVRDETGQIVKWFGTCTDIEDQKRVEQALLDSQERIRALIDSNIIGITSNEGEEEVLVEANEAFLQMTGYTQEDVRSRTLNRVKITPPEQAPLFQRALQEVAKRGQHTPIETEIVCKDGSRLPVLAGGVAFQDHPRQIIGFVLDNSARKELEQRKDDFISMASHELRNPLAAVKMQTQLVRKRLERQAHHEAATALSKVEGPVKQLERLIAELLDVSKIQAGSLEYRQEPVDLDALLREITDTMQQSNPSHTLVVRGTVEISLIGDPDRLGQVFINLLSNAIKYSPDAETVEMDLSASEDAVTVSVRDHGLGIPREQRDKIFERFYRASGPKQRAIPGLGMGLYIVAEIVKRQGGTITVESAVGKGSTFTVTLPRKRDA
jgi:PAS domain S-box-containing protein